jgi:ribosomal protein S18 acetylase RimI-like enzyme
MATKIRRATSDDAATLAELGRVTFIEAFGHLYTPEDLQAFVNDSHSVAAYAHALEHPRYALWLAEHDGVAIGYAQAGPCGLPHADAQPGDGELKRLYLLPTAQNSGVGVALLEVALAWLERDGPRTLWISVWSENYGAQRFYGRHGFVHAGEYEFIVGEQRDREFMWRRLPAIRQA